jgi:CubicO group peptidase (beta-lactamase class C family)
MIRSASFAALCAAALACSRVGGAVTGAVALGFRDVATRSPYRLDTVQSVGSISKTTVGYALALLNTRGPLDLDAPIEVWLPYKVRNPRHAAAPITARQLATHTAGVLDRPATYRRAYQRTSTPTISMADFVRQYFEPDGQLYNPANFGTEAPGLQFQYSNMGAALAATVVERLTGQAFSDYAQAQIFAPLGMTDTTWEQRPGPNSATPHKANGKAWPSYSLVTYADGALRSSCRDLARYGTALLRAARRVDTSEPNQGLFWQHRRSGGIGHSGSDPGISAFLLLQPDQRRGQLLLTNCGLDESKRFETGFGRIWSLLRGTEPPQR